jgi:hypothetical protein
MMVEMKGHFTSNQMLRELFPELCPKQQKNGKIEDFGNMEQFTVPRRWTPTIKEPTVYSPRSRPRLGLPRRCGQERRLGRARECQEHRSRSRWSRTTTPSLTPSSTPTNRTSVKPEVMASVGQPRDGCDVVGTRYSFSDLWGQILNVEAASKESALKAKREYKPTFMWSRCPRWPKVGLPLRRTRWRCGKSDYPLKCYAKGTRKTWR